MAPSNAPAPIVVKPKLSLDALRKEAELFATEVCKRKGKTLPKKDGKSIGTYIEQEFLAWLMERYEMSPGNSALGIDIPDINVDIKTTSISQPQSSSPFKDAGQKVFGLGHSLLIFIYQWHTKKSKAALPSDLGPLQIKKSIFLKEDETSDRRLTTQIKAIVDDVGAYEEKIAKIIHAFEKGKLSLIPAEATKLAQRALANPPAIGKITVSNAMQWRLTFKAAVAGAEAVEVIKSAPPREDSFVGS